MRRRATPDPHRRVLRAAVATRAGRAILLALVAPLGCACASSSNTPLLHVPLMTRAGQVEAGMTIHPTAQRMQLGGTVRGAITDHLRAGASVSTAHPRDASAVDVRRSSLLADGFIGFEGRGLFLRYGGLLGSGYGVASTAVRRCAGGARAVPCDASTPAGARERYVRSYGQMHVGIAPPGPLMVSFAVRVPFLVGLGGDLYSDEARASTELAFTHSFAFRFFRLDLQPLWSRAQGLSFQLAVLGRFSP